MEGGVILRTLRLKPRWTHTWELPAPSLCHAPRAVATVGRFSTPGDAYPLKPLSVTPKVPPPPTTFTIRQVESKALVTRIGARLLPQTGWRRRPMMGWTVSSKSPIPTICIRRPFTDRVLAGQGLAGLDRKSVV